MKTDAKEIMQFIEDRVLTGKSSIHIRDLVNALPENTEEAASFFCDHFELGNWFYEALILNEIDIANELLVIGSRWERAEAEDSRDRDELRRDMQAEQI